MKKYWFEGSSIIDCNFQILEPAIENHANFYEGVVSCMSGISSVEVLEQGGDYLIFKTNEGIMKRTNIKKSYKPDIIEIEFDEEYKAGRIVTAHSHFLEKFTPMENGIRLETTISDVKAPGILGLIYRLFGSANIGKAILRSHKIYLEALKDR